MGGLSADCDPGFVETPNTLDEQTLSVVDDSGPFEKLQPVKLAGRADSGCIGKLCCVPTLPARHIDNARL